jgi:hypothetical protein
VSRPNGTVHAPAPPPLALYGALNAVLAGLGIAELAPERREELVRALDRELRYSDMLGAMRHASQLIGQVHKTLDPYEGMTIRLWKRILINEMQLHANAARERLAEFLPE